jgi:hypothetical protein
MALQMVSLTILQSVLLPRSHIGSSKPSTASHLFRRCTRSQSGNLSAQIMVRQGDALENCEIFMRHCMPARSVLMRSIVVRLTHTCEKVPFPALSSNER